MNVEIRKNTAEVPQDVKEILADENYIISKVDHMAKFKS
jgi:hypothetical protein